MLGLVALLWRGRFSVVGVDMCVWLEQIGLVNMFGRFCCGRF